MALKEKLWNKVEQVWEKMVGIVLTSPKLRFHTWIGTTTLRFVVLRSCHQMKTGKKWEIWIRGLRGIAAALCTSLRDIIREPNIVQIRTNFICGFWLCWLLHHKQRFLFKSKLYSWILVYEIRRFPPRSVSWRKNTESGQSRGWFA